MSATARPNHPAPLGPREVVLDVLDRGRTNFSAVAFRGQDSGDCGRFFFARGKFGGTGVRGSLDDFQVAQMVLYPAAALAERITGVKKNELYKLALALKDSM